MNVPHLHVKDGGGRTFIYDVSGKVGCPDCFDEWEAIDWARLNDDDFEDSDPIPFERWTEKEFDEQWVDAHSDVYSYVVTDYERMVCFSECDKCGLVFRSFFNKYPWAELVGFGPCDFSIDRGAKEIANYFGARKTFSWKTTWDQIPIPSSCIKNGELSLTYWDMEACDDQAERERLEAERKQLVDYWLDKRKGKLRKKEIKRLNLKMREIREGLKCNVSEGADCGIYALMGEGELLYIGRSINIATRIENHKKDKIFDSILSWGLPGEFQDYAERILLNAFKPPLNKVIPSVKTI